jgi:hypothetical protein
MSGKNDSPGFRAAWFFQQFESGRECPTLDFKRQLYKFSSDEAKSDEAKFEFARDVIAFANVAWRTGQPCRILFGIQVDEGGRSLRDVRDEYPGEKPPKGWHHPDTSIHEKQVDGVEKVLHEVAAQWIEPDVADLFHLEYGEVEGKFVSYLEIKPVQTPGAFRLKQPGTKKKHVYRAGDVFVRCGASTMLVDPSQVPYLRPASRAAYLDQGQWKRIILAHTVGDFEAMQSLLPSFQPRAKGQHTTAFDAVLQALNEGKRLVMVEGNAGEGKTVLIHRIAFALAQRHNLDQPTRREYFAQEDLVADSKTVDNVADDLEVVPAQPVPIFMALRAAFEMMSDFTEQLLGQVRGWMGHSNLNALDLLFEIPGSHWVILLDGVDEIRNRQEFAPHLRTWLQRLPSNVQAVVTTRPSYASFDIPGTVRVCLDPLTKDEVLYLLMGKLPSEDEGNDIRSEVENWMLQHPDLLPMLARQRALDGLVNFLTGKTASLITDIDQDQVEIVEPRTVLPAGVGDGNIPVIASEVLMGEGMIETTGVDTDLPEEERWAPPQIALALQSITEHMRQEEVKRQQDWGDNKQRIVDLAEYDLGQVAWNTDWERDFFDPAECEDKGWLHPETLVWNEDIGFVERQRVYQYCFFCSLFRQYIAAKSAFDRANAGGGVRAIKPKIGEQGLERHAAQIVLDLLNGLRAANGQEVLTFTKFERFYFSLARRLRCLFNPS